MLTESYLLFFTVRRPFISRVSLRELCWDAAQEDRAVRKRDSLGSAFEQLALEKPLVMLDTRVLRGPRLYPNPQQVSEASSLWPVGECSQGKSTDWIRTLGIWIGSALRQGLVHAPSLHGQGLRARPVVRHPVSRREDARTVHGLRPYWEWVPACRE